MAATGFTREQVRGWRDGADGFFHWLKDVKPRVPSSRGGFEVFHPVDFQMAAVRDALARKDNGDWKYTTIAFSFPRRHSKTTLMALLVLWRFTTRATQNIVCMATSERQIMATGFALVRQIVLNTPALLHMVGKENIREYRLVYPELQNSIRTVSCNTSGIYGEKITVAWMTELHAAQSEEPMQVLASSLGDTLNSWMLIDSTVDGIGGPLHRLEQLAENGEDETVFVRRIEYADLAEAMEKSPPWIRRDWLKSRKAQLLPATFETQHLNRRTAATNSLFAPEDIAACREALPLPVEKIGLEAWAAGRTWLAGGGLDRAYFGSLHGDKTIWTSVAKVASLDGGEPHYVVLNQKNILGSMATGIKRAILDDVERYGLHNVVIEAYNAQDIGIWAQENNIPAELVHATNTAQTPAFLEFHRIVKEHRLHFPDKLEELVKEMGTFTYELVNGSPRFGSDKFHDDRVYSLCWAIYSLRQNELAAYTLANIICDSRSPHGRFCYLRTGDAILNCAKTCSTHARVQGMYLQHRKANVESDISLPDFFKNCVKVTGSRLYSSF